MIRLGLAVGGAALVLLGGTALAWQSSSTGTGSTATVSNVRGIKIAGGSGDVEVRYVPGAAAEVHQHQQRWGWTWWDHPAKPAVRDGELELDTGCGWMCSSSYVVTLPQPVGVSGRLGSGDLKVTGMSSVDAQVGSGSVRLRDVGGATKVRASSGNIVLERAGGSVDLVSSSGDITGSDLRSSEVSVQASSGDVRLGLASPASVTGEVSSGDLEVTVPQGAYRVETSVGSGSESVRVANDPNAQRRLKLHAGSGDIHVYAS